MDLLIVESPTKARTLSKFLGKDYEVLATMGHVKDLPKSQLGIDVEHNFKPEYIGVEKTKSVLKEITKVSKKANKVYLATDPDREGEAISFHVDEEIGGGKTVRIVFHEITKEAVEEAIAHPRKIDINLVDAQIGRRVLDRLVGYKLSPLLWRKVRRGLSAGRVQSVAVRLIVEKEREIEKFKAVEYWEIFADLETRLNKNFQARLTKISGKTATVNNKAEADKILGDLKTSTYIVENVTKREIRKKPYPPFTTSTMTQAGSRLFGWSSKKTMHIAQMLYEEGVITYHRTDSLNISIAAVEKAREFIKKEYGDSFLPGAARIYKTKSKVAQEAHEAIRPTDIFKDPASFEGQNDSKKLYDLIWRRFVASQTAEAVYDETAITVAAGIYLLRASGQIMKFEGWRKVIPAAKLTDEVVVTLPSVEKGEALKLIKVDGTQKFTEPPPRFNEASLIKTLESLGIGRPSTYAPTISTILFRNYVEKDDGKFKPTPVGVAVNDFLVGNFPDVFEYKFTAEMEDNLDKIANGESKWTDTIEKFWKPFSKKLETVGEKSERVKIEVEKLGRTCPKCGKGELVVRIGRFGKFISCSNFPECDYTEKFLEKVGMVCPKCGKGDVILKKTSKGRKFFGCSRYPECDFASWKNPKLNSEDDQEPQTAN